MSRRRCAASLRRGSEGTVQGSEGMVRAPICADPSHSHHRRRRHPRGTVPMPVAVPQPRESNQRSHQPEHQLKHQSHQLNLAEEADTMDDGRWTRKVAAVMMMMMMMPTWL
eukprot:6132852-Pyramimonas_sp.AAC.1